MVDFDAIVSSSSLIGFAHVFEASHGGNADAVEVQVRADPLTS